MHARELLAAGMGGLAATSVDVTTLVLLVHRAAPIALAAFCGAAAGAATAFTLNKYVAFRDRSRITVQQCARFGLVAVATALLMALAMQIACVGLGVPYLAAKLACSVVIFAVWTFPAQRRLVFTPIRSSP